MPWMLSIAHAAAAARLSPEIESFLLAVVAALGAAWLLALRIVLRVGGRRQRAGVWVVTLLGAAGAGGLSAIIVMDFVQPPRVVTGTIQSLGEAPGTRVPDYTVVVDGTPYGIRRTDYEKLRTGARIRGRAGAAFNFLQRVETVP